MPGRITRGGRTASKSTTTAATESSKTRARASSPSTTGTIPDEGALTTLRRSVCEVLADAQKTTATHRKLVIKLRKIQEACCYEAVDAKQANRSVGDDFDEVDFNRELTRCMLRVLAIRKAEPAGDRIVRFLGTFLNSASVKDLEIARQSEDEDAMASGDTPTSRLTTYLLEEMLLRLDAKDKTIRFRATQITSHIINSLDALDDTLFHRLRLNLLRRIHDKEAPVRSQAVYGLGRLAAELEEEDGGEDSDSDNGVGAGVLQKLLNVLQNDPSPEVRRNLLLNLPLTKEVLPYLLERARDVDAQTRRALYARLLPALGDFRHLSLTHREKLLRWGLRDRDENVRKATARLFRERWIEDCAALPAAAAAEQSEEGADGAEHKGAKQAADPSLDALLELLERIDVVNSSNEGGMALVAMNEFWDGRPDYVDYVSFPDHFWQDLNPELAFVARTFNDYCRGPGERTMKGLEAIAEEKLPELTRFGFYLEREIKKLIEITHTAALGDEEAEEDAPQVEFVVEQLLHMALLFDYSDEVGRRKIFALMRESLALPDLPEECTRLAVEVLRLVCGESARGEVDFCTVVLEAVAEVHDSIMANLVNDNSSIDESFHSATSQLDGDLTPQAKSKSKKLEDGGNAEVDEEKAVREIMVNMKCLHIALCMLQNVACDLKSNVHLTTMLNNLVVPAVRSQEAPLRERGLLCMGLCCLLDKNLAEENLNLFLHCFSRGHPALQVIALQIISDVLITHPSMLAEPVAANDESVSANELKPQVVKVFSKSLKSDDHAVQSTGSAALAKLMLSQLITDASLLKNLVVAYFDPDTKANATMQQGLTYFLPVYCRSRAENAKRMAEVACPALTKLATLKESLQDDADVEEDGADDMVSLSRISQMLVDWTDPRKIVGFAEATGTSTTTAADEAADVHFVLADNILDRMVYNQVSKEERKILFSMLGKLHLPTTYTNEELLKSVLTSISEAIDSKLATDATSKSTLNKVRDQLLKTMNRIATAERGGGGAEETVVLLDPREQATAAAAAAAATTAGDSPDGDIMDSFNEDVTEDPATPSTQLQDPAAAAAAALQDGLTLGTTTSTTLGLTLGQPDAEGTKTMQFAAADADTTEDVDMMDVDDYTEVTETS